MGVITVLFHEVYSAYFNTIAAIIARAQTGEITHQDISMIIGEKAFSESMLTILPAIKSGEWLVMYSDFHTPIKKPPQMPLTFLQKRWLKTLLTDPRIALFQVNGVGLEDVEPLFAMDDLVFFDRYADGDTFSDSAYIENFRVILTAFRERRRLLIEYRNRHGRLMRGEFIPYKLEYSAKDDKFRLETSGGRHAAYINVGRIENCQLLEPFEEMHLIPPKRKENTVSFMLLDERNALDRVMLHFSDCHKETVRIDNKSYQVKLWYESQDETEILIRILAFGPMIKVIAPDSFITLIKNRLTMQQAIKK
jgi:hypothetical protein